MTKSNSNQQQLSNISDEIANTQLFHSISHQLTQVLLKNYFDDIPNDSDERLLFGYNYDDLYALILAINEFQIHADKQLKTLSTLVNEYRRERV